MKRFIRQGAGAVLAGTLAAGLVAVAGAPASAAPRCRLEIYKIRGTSYANVRLDCPPQRGYTYQRTRFYGEDYFSGDDFLFGVYGSLPVVRRVHQSILNEDFAASDQVYARVYFKRLGRVRSVTSNVVEGYWG